MTMSVFTSHRCQKILCIYHMTSTFCIFNVHYPRGGGEGGLRPCEKIMGGLASLKLSVAVMESLA